MTSTEIRESFIKFFKNKKHQIVLSAPMVIKNDPTLMFTNAGMNQFKDLFLGNSEIKDSKVANSQKCLRVSGKHNDLEAFQNSLAGPAHPAEVVARSAVRSPTSTRAGGEDDVSSKQTP